MSWSQRAEHIWEYYKIHICGTIFAIAIIIAITTAIRSNQYESVCTTVIADGYMTGFKDHTDALTTGFTEYLGINGKSERVTFNNAFSLIAQEGDTDAYYSAEKIVSMAATSSVDGFMASMDYIAYFSDDEELFLTDLREVFTNAQLAQLGDALLYYTMEDGTKIPFAVDLSDTKIVTETDLYMAEPCFGIVTTAPYRENAVSFIKYAFDIE